MKYYLSFLLMAVFLSSADLAVAAPSDGVWTLVRLGDKPVPKSPTVRVTVSGDKISTRGFATIYKCTLVDGVLLDISGYRRGVKEAPPEMVKYEKAFKEAIVRATIALSEKDELLFKKEGKTTAVLKRRPPVALPKKTSAPKAKME